MLPVRSDVEFVTYWRNPAAFELKQGYGAIHYRDFPVDECCIGGTRYLKKWFVSKDDGLRYYR